MGTAESSSGPCTKAGSPRAPREGGRSTPRCRRRGPAASPPALRGPSSERVGEPEQRLEREVRSILREDHRPGPQREGHRRRTIQEVLDGPTEEDGNGRRPVLPEGDEERDVEGEREVDLLRRR